MAAKLQKKCELAKNANLILPIPIGKGIALSKGSHFFLLRSCHKPASVHVLEAVAGFPDRLDFPHLLTFCGLLCLFHHAAGVDVGHGGLDAPVPHLPLHHGELLSLPGPPCSVGMSILLVAVTYDRKTKEHRCEIETISHSTA